MTGSACELISKPTIAQTTAITKRRQPRTIVCRRIRKNGRLRALRMETMPCQMLIRTNRIDRATAVWMAVRISRDMMVRRN